MPKLVTLDSSVIIAALRESEEYHIQCKKLLESVNNGEFVAVEPYTVLIEIQEVREFAMTRLNRNLFSIASASVRRSLSRQRSRPCRQPLLTMKGETL